MADNEELLFDSFDSNYIRLCRINDILDDIPGMKAVGYGHGLEKSERTLKIDEEFLDYYRTPEKNKTIVDYKIIFDIFRKLYVSRYKSMDPEKREDTSYKDTPLELEGEVPEEFLKRIANEFYTDLFSKDGIIATDFMKENLQKVEAMINGYENSPGKLMIYNYDESHKNLPRKPVYTSVQMNGKNENVVCVPIKQKNGESIITLQDLYLIVHEMGHALSKQNVERNSRTGNMMGECDSMVIEPLFSEFLLRKISKNEISIHKDAIYEYEHGPSRIRDAGTLSMAYKLACYFYQRDLENKGEFNPDEEIINYEEPEIQEKIIREWIFEGKEISDDDMEKSKWILNMSIQGLKEFTPEHSFNNYHDPRYTIGNILSPYIVNTFIRDKDEGLQMLQSLWNSINDRDIDVDGRGRMIDGRIVTGIEAAFLSMGVDISNDGVNKLIKGYEEWIKKAEEHNEEMFIGTRVELERKSGLDDCMEDDKTRLSNVQNATRITRKDFEQQLLGKQTVEKKYNGTNDDNDEPNL